LLYFAPALIQIDEVFAERFNGKIRGFGGAVVFFILTKLLHDVLRTLSILFIDRYKIESFIIANNYICIKLPVHVVELKKV
jgi:hypothetical protein